MTSAYISAISLLVFILTSVGVKGHSWLACTDYTEKNGGTWDERNCRGFPRNAHVKAQRRGVFGLDTGYDHRPSHGNVCKFPLDSTSYTNDHPIAVYYPGQQVVLVHPMKNHGADGECGSIWIPDTGSWLMAVRTNGSNNDPDLQTFRTNVVFDLGRSPSGNDYGGNFALGSVYPKPGYANAPLFCQNTDKAMATYSFNVPRNMRPGLYTFVWLWAFNSAVDLYSTCFEVEVVRNKAERDRQLQTLGITDLTEPCGGLTSNPNVMGNSNPGCTRPRVNVQTYAVVSGGGLESSSTTTQSTTQRTTTTSRPTTTTTNSRTTEIHAPTNNIPMLSTQFSGDIILPETGRNAIRKLISIDFRCNVEIASFWNCQVISDPENLNHYDLVQRGASEIEIGTIFYHVSFIEPCDLSRHPPAVHLVREELQ